MPYKDPEKQRVYNREQMARLRKENPEYAERQRERDKVRWETMTPEQRKGKEAQRTPEGREKRRLDMQRYMADPANRAHVNVMRNARRAKRIERGDTSVNEMHREASRRYEAKYRGSIEYHARKILATAKHRSKKKGMSFNLTLDWYLGEFPKGCVVTGLPFDSHLEDSPWVPHIDKIVPEKGYVMENCRLVCGCYNLAKFDWTDADVLKMAKALIGNISDA